MSVFFLTLAALAAGLLVLGRAKSAGAYEVHDGPTGVLKYDPEKTWGDYTLFAPTPKCTTTYLIDMKGDVVHKWEHPYEPGLFARLLPNGNLLRGARLPDQRIDFGGVGGMVEEITWDGQVVWSYTMHNENELQHHCFDRMPNGNTLILGWERISRDAMIAKGRRPDSFPVEGVKDDLFEYKDFWIDFAREVDKDGKTVWEWHSYDHLGIGPDKLNPNCVLPKAVGTVYWSTDWSHFNTLEYVPEKDWVLMNSRNLSETYLIDRKSGKIVWRWGNPASYGHGKAPAWYDDGDQQLFGSHHATWLENGHIQIFDNGSERPQGNRSRVIEVDPKTNEIVWEYKANSTNSFYSYRQGSAQRLPNGNVLVTSTQNGHVFEVTREGEVVWEFVNPIFFGQPYGIMSDKDHVIVKPNGKKAINFYQNMIHRSYRYSKDHPALKGRDLKSQGYIVPGWPRYFETYKPL